MNPVHVNTDDIPFADPADAGPYLWAARVRAHEARLKAAEAAKMQAAADAGRYLCERDDDELTALDAAPLFGDLLARVIPGRAGSRAAAAALIRELESRGHVAFLKHGAARVAPPAPPDLASAVDALQPFLCDLLDDGHRQTRRPDPDAPGEEAGSQVVSALQTQMGQPAP